VKRSRPLSKKAPRPLPHHLGAAVEIDPGSARVGVTEDIDPAQWSAVYDSLLRESLALFARDVLGMELAPHITAWSDLVSRQSRLAIEAARDHGKSAFFSYAFPIWRAWSEPGCEVYLFSKTLEQAMDFLDIIMWGRNNLAGIADTPALAHLVPGEEGARANRKVRLKRQDVILNNGSRIRAVGYGKAIRGRHPKYVVCDDVLNDNDLWSETERRKNISYFYSAIVNMVMPSVQEDDHFTGGQLITVGTPYHMADLYAELEKNAAYDFHRYPGIIRDDDGTERALFPWRWSLDQLKKKKGEIGSVAFAREIMCRPVTDDISIFPSYLFPPLFDERLTLRPTKAEIAQRGLTVYMGVDIARSASVGADYFVIYTLGKDREGTRYLIDIHRSKGLPFRKQLEQIDIAAKAYEPSLIHIESNAMQQIYTDEVRRMSDLPVKEFITHATNKYPLDKGVPGLRILLENQKFVIPRGDEYSRRTSDIWIDECSQFGFVDGKLQGIGVHDDTVMAWWFADEAARAGGFSFAFDDETGNDGLEPDETDTDANFLDVLIGPPGERGDNIQAYDLFGSGR